MIEPTAHTAYGCAFRSTSEAILATWMTIRNIPWQYEPQGFLMKNVPYLPDFWLPQQKLWIEVKGPVPDLQAQLKATALARSQPWGAAMVWIWAWNDWRNLQSARVWVYRPHPAPAPLLAHGRIGMHTDPYTRKTTWNIVSGNTIIPFWDPGDGTFADALHVLTAWSRAVALWSPRSR